MEIHTNQDFQTASDPNTSRRLLHALAQTDDEEIQYLLATNPSTSLNTLKLLYTYDNPIITSGIISNPNCSEQFLTQIALEQSLDTNIPQTVVALNIISPESLTTIWRDEMFQNAEAMYAFSNKLNLPPTLIEHFFNDSVFGFNLHILEKFSSLFQTPEHIVNEIINRIDVSLANQPSLTYASRTLPTGSVIASEHDRMTTLGILVALAHNLHSSPHTLSQVSECEDYAVRINLAQNKKLPADACFRLLLDKNVKVRSAAYYHFNTPEDVRQAALFAGGIDYDIMLEEAYQANLKGDNS